MAVPRVFVSSTYYDLRHVRDDIEIFLKGLGYTPVMHDKGNITYTQAHTSLEQSCYNEISMCDIVICIIGNKYGTQSSGSDYSITMEELQEAIRKRKKIYIYILKDVYSENFTYNKNKKNGEFEPFHVDDIRVHEFITHIKETVKNAPVQSFESVSDITSNLKQQLAGLFQHLLSQEAIATESKTYEDLQGAALKIEGLISNLSMENECFFQKFNSSMFAVLSPLRRILYLLGIEHFKLFAPDKTSIIEFMQALGYHLYPPDNEHLEFQKNDGNYIKKLVLNFLLFDSDDRLKDVRDKKLLDEYIKFDSFINPLMGDDLPF